MAAVAGLCFDAAPRAATEWTEAAAECAKGGLALPSVGQLIAAATTLGNVSAGGEWTDGFFEAGGEQWGVLVEGAGSPSSDKIAENHPYRCVTQLLR